MCRWRSVLVAAVIALVAAGCSDEQASVGEARRFDGAADCSTDVTGQLNEFIAALPDGVTMNFQDGACHRIDGTVLIDAKRDLTFEGNGATLKAGSQGDMNRRHVDFQGGGGFTIRDLTLVGAHPGAGPEGYVRELERQHGLSFAGVDGAEVSNVTINDVYGDFMRFGGREGAWTRNVDVTGSRFDGSGRQGIHFAAAEDIRIEGNSFTGVARSVFDVEPNGPGGGAKGVDLVDNQISNWGNLVLPVGGKGEVRDIALVGTRLLGKHLDVLVKEPRREQEGDGQGLRRSNISIIGNVSDTRSSQTAVSLTAVDGAVVRDNVQPFEGDDTTVAVKVTASCDVEVEDNLFEGVPTPLEQDDFACQ